MRGPKTKIAILFAATMLCANGQWLNYPTPGTPRTRDGKPNLSAPAPRASNGKPDLSGIWVTMGGYTGNIAKDLKPGEVSFQPWAEALYKHRLDTQGKDDPQAYCVLSGVPREHVVPYPFKILNTNGMVVILYEALHSYRQIFMDGRTLQKDPEPTWMGYSTGAWEGDALVVRTTGFNDKTWLDDVGHPHSESMKVIERYRRPDYGHLLLEITVEDEKAYTRPWTVTQELRLDPTGDLIEYVCNENERDAKEMQETC